MSCGEVSFELAELIQKPITCHAWCPDGKKVAISTGDEHCLIFVKNNTGWNLESTLTGHTQRISGIDWYHNNKEGDRLITVSFDRSGVVWTRHNNQDQWSQSLVALRLRRGASSVRWSSDGRKFAVGSSEGLVAIGHFEASQDWWVCKHLKSLDGTAILDIAWHPTGTHLAIATLSGKIYLMSAGLKAVDGVDVTFDEVVWEDDFKCWIHALAFSPNGEWLAGAAHDSNVYLISISGDYKKITLTSPCKLPVRRVQFVNDLMVIACGFDTASPFMICKDGNGWSLEGELQKLTKKTISNSNANTNSSAFGGAMAKFKALDSHGVPITTTTDTTSRNNVLHTGSISDLRLTGGGVSSVGHDGRLVIWHLGDNLKNRVKIAAL